MIAAAAPLRHRLEDRNCFVTQMCLPRRCWCSLKSFCIAKLAQPTALLETFACSLHEFEKQNFLPRSAQTAQNIIEGWMRRKHFGHEKAAQEQLLVQ